LQWAAGEARRLAWAEASWPAAGGSAAKALRPLAGRWRRAGGPNLQLWALPAAVVSPAAAPLPQDLGQY
jgi:hypothetical protein